MMTEQNLILHRQKIDQLRQSSSLSLSPAAQLEQSIVSSWQRSSVAHIPKDRLAALLLDLRKVRSPSTLSHALQYCALRILNTLPRTVFYGISSRRCR